MKTKNQKKQDQSLQIFCSKNMEYLYILYAKISVDSEE